MLQEVQLEPAHRADAARIAEMSRALIERGLPWRWTPGAVAALLHDLEACVLIARREARIVGFAAMKYRFTSREAHLLLLAVDPALRRRGLGRALYEWLEVLARRGGIRSLALEVRADNRGAREFYRELGYREVAKLPGYYQGRADAVRMRRRT